MLLFAACSYQPARFADRPPVEQVDDRRPIPIPRRNAFIEPVYFADIYLRRPIIDALDPARFPYARDVNSLDEVPESSWFQSIAVEPDAFERAYVRDGPPVPPFRVERDKIRKFVLTDSRGKSFVLRGDPPKFEATQTAAAIISSRLLRAVGYRTLEVWPVDRKLIERGAEIAPTGEHLIAVRWPIGIELGATDMTRTRDEDTNDRIDHRNRRTLRALGVFAAWLDLGDLGPTRLVDAYIGRPGHGHVEHFVVGLHESLGATWIGTKPPEKTAAGVVRGNPFVNLATLGLARPHEEPMPADRTLRRFSPRVSGEYELRAPYEPVDRLLRSDGYWAAKRLSRIPHALLKSVVSKAGIGDADVERHVVDALSSRRRALINHWFLQVTPCEIDVYESPRLVLRDLSLEQTIESSVNRWYDVDYLDDEGDQIAPSERLLPIQDEVRIELPRAALTANYLIVRVTVVRGGVAAPESLQAHFRKRDTGLAWVGLRH